MQRTDIKDLRDGTMVEEKTGVARRNLQGLVSATCGQGCAGSETAVWGGKMPNAGKTEHRHFTGIWMKPRGRWQEVARHANIVAQQ